MDFIQSVKNYKIDIYFISTKIAALTLPPPSKIPEGLPGHSPVAASLQNTVGITSRYVGGRRQ
jgi:hypothetical protein